MGVKFKRHKKKSFLLSIVYRVSKLLWMSKKRKFKLFLDLEWIFERLAHETSFQVYSAEVHPLRVFSSRFLLQFIRPDDTVLDLGCKYGEISYALAGKAKKVVGIDYDDAAIARAKALHRKENLFFETGDALLFLRNNNEKFNVLILSHILEHIDDPEKLLMDFKSHVDHIYVEVPDFDKSYLNHYRKELECDLIYTDTDHISEFDRQDLAQLFEKCNLVMQSSEYRFGVQRYWLKTTPN